MFTFLQTVDPTDPNRGIKDQKRTMAWVVVGAISFVLIVTALASLGIDIPWPTNFGP